MRTIILFVIAVIFTGCAAPQKSGIAGVPEEQPLEKYVREWKEKNSNRTELINEYLKRITGREKKSNLTNHQEDIPLNNAKKYGIQEEEGRSKLKRMARVEFNKRELILALFNRAAEHENLVLSLYQKTEDGSYSPIFESKEEGNVFIDVTVFRLGKGNGDCIYLEYGVCTCNSTGKIYISKAGNSLQEIYSGGGEGLSITFEDLDNDGVSELIETNGINSLLDLTRAIKENFKDIAPRELMMASIVTRIVVYRWDGKEFKNSGDLYR